MVLSRLTDVVLRETFRRIADSVRGLVPLSLPKVGVVACPNLTSLADYACGVAHMQGGGM